VTLKNRQKSRHFIQHRRGRPTIRHDGIPLTAAERAKRYRKSRRYRVNQKRKKQERKRRNGNWEWYTPQHVVDAVRKVFRGRIDLDPASSAIAQTVVKAKTYFTVDDDGLQHEWHGKVMLNPPYTGYLISRFVDKLLEEIAAKRVTEAILIAHPNTSTKWFARASRKATEICFSHRIPCWSPDSTKNNNNRWSIYGQVYLYYGDYPNRFRSIFKEFYNFTPY
jgi:ParB family chromosome partitioning protein